MQCHISKIMAKRHGTKTLLSFFQMQDKQEMLQNANLINSRRTSFADDIDVTFIMQYLYRNKQYLRF